MNKRNTMVIFIGLMFFVSLLFSGCNNIFSPLSSVPLTGGDGMGKVTVSFSAGRAAIMPSLLDFDWYKFTFIPKNGGDPVSETKSKNEAFTFSLEMGKDYTLEVKAYKDSDSEENLGAEGTSDQFTVRAVTAVPVTLNGFLTNGQGSFSYTITLPVNTEVDLLELYLDESFSMDLPADKIDGVISHTVQVPAGRYLLMLWLSNGALEAEDYQGVVIYSNAVTYYGTEAEPIIFRNSDFRSPDGESSEPVRVYFWHGFDIEGSDAYYEAGNYISGNAIGNRYDTYIDNEGIHEDVLKMEPPFASGYRLQTMILTHPIINAGTYSLSMDYFVEKRNENAIIFWYNVNTWGVVVGKQDNLPEEEYGTWLHMEGSFTLGANDEIGLIAWNDGGDYGLKDSVIYIKNLELKDAYGNLVPEPDYGIHYDLDVYPKTILLIPDGSLTIESKYEVNWANSSYNTNIITIDSDGKVTAKTTGTTTITASLKADPGVSVEIPVKVIAKPTGSKYIAFTFDDGPDIVWTPRFVNVLNGLGAQATFFCMGNKIDDIPMVAKATSDAGHEVGNHTYEHTMALQNESVNTIRAELEQTQIAIKNATGKDNKVFRGPALLYSKYGDGGTSELQYGENMQEAARQLGLAIIDGSGHQAANFDFEPSHSAEYIAQRNLEEQAKEWGILLMHDGWPYNVANTYKALPILIEGLYAQGYQILSASEMAEKRKIAVGLEPAFDLEPGRIHYDMIHMPEHVNSIEVKMNGAAVSGDLIELGAGQTVTLTPVISPAGAAVQEVFWYSDNSSIAGVDGNGILTAYRAGNTTIRVAAGGMRTIITVIVDGEGPTDPDPFEIITEWKDTDYFSLSGEYVPGNDFYYGSQALTEIYPEFNGYGNVLMLYPPEGGYFSTDTGGGMALTFVAPEDGEYTISLDYWVNNSNVNVVFHECGSGWGEFLSGGEESGYNYYVQPGQWNTKTGVKNVRKGMVIGLLAHSYTSGMGLHNANIYIRDFKVELNSEILIDIPSTAIDEPPETFNPGITFKWAPTGFSLVASENSLTITQGETITIAAPAGFNYYDWYVGTKLDDTQTANIYTFDSSGKNPGLYKISLVCSTVAGTPSCDTIEITVVR